MKTIGVFYLKIFIILEVYFSIYLNRHVFVILRRGITTILKGLSDCSSYCMHSSPIQFCTLQASTNVNGVWSVNTPEDKFDHNG